MRKMRTIRFLALVFLASAASLNQSCKKNTNEVDTETQSVVDNSICEQEFMQMQATISNLAIKTKGTGAQRLQSGQQVLATCDSLTYLSGDTTYTNLLDPPTYEYDFANCSLTNVDGVVRTGKFWVRFLGRPVSANSKTIIKLNNYRVNGALTYSCDSIIVSTLSNSIPTKSFRVQVINGICSGNGWSVKFHSDKTINLSTQSTTALNDDVLTVTGTAGGTNRNNLDFDVVINNITKPSNCKFITEGTLDITPSGFSTRTVNYGSGACDDDATFTVNGQTIAFKLK